MVEYQLQITRSVGHTIDWSEYKQTLGAQRRDEILFGVLHLDNSTVWEKLHSKFPKDHGMNDEICFVYFFKIHHNCFVEKKFNRATSMLTKILYSYEEKVLNEVALMFTTNRNFFFFFFLRSSFSFLLSNIKSV